MWSFLFLCDIVVWCVVANSIIVLVVALPVGIVFDAGFMIVAVGIVGVVNDDVVVVRDVSDDEFTVVVDVMCLFCC